MMKSIRRLFHLNLTLGLLIPVLLISVLSIGSAYFVINKEVSAKNAQLNYLFTASINTKLKDITSLLEYHAQYIEAHLDTTLLIRTYIEKLRQEHKLITRVYLLDNNGYLQFVSPTDDNILGIDMSGYDFYTQSLANPGPYWSPAFRIPLSPYPHTALSRSFSRGILVIFFDLSWILQDVEEILSLYANKIAILDQHGTYIAHSDSTKARQSFVDPYFNQFREQYSGSLFRQRAVYDEQPNICYVNFLPDCGWATVIYQPEANIYGPIQNLSATLVLITLCIVTITLSLTSSSLNILNGATRDFITSVGKLKAGEYNYRMTPFRYQEFNELSRQFNTMAEAIESREKKLIAGEERLKQTLNQKETLLKEIHHRLKNNLSVIYSLVQFEKTSLAPAPVEVLDQIQHRIKAIALIHEKLYMSEDLSRIDFAAYCGQFMEYFSASIASRQQQIIFEPSIEAVYLNIEQAMPCGLILNELITNSVKHAFPGPGQLNIRINAWSEDGKIILHYADNGSGVQSPEKLLDSGSTGTMIIQALVAQLEGSISFFNAGGLNCRILFPR